MPRITRDGVTYHPDQLDRTTGEPLEAQAAEAEPTEAEIATAKLTELGATKSGTWWALEIDGTTHKANGAVAALAKFEGAGA